MEEYIRVKLVPAICKYYAKDTQKIVKSEVRPLVTMVDNWSSLLFELDLTIRCDNEYNKETEKYSFFIKCTLEDRTRRKFMHTTKQFANEIHIYKMVKPIFNKLLVNNAYSFVDVPYAALKDVIYSGSEDATDGIIVMENLKTHGFKLGPRNGFDFEHCRLALEQLGRWHAMSLMLKESNAEEFRRRIVDPLNDCQFCDDVRTNRIKLVYEATVNRLHRRPEYLEHAEAREAITLLKQRSTNIVAQIRKMIQNSAESELGLLCHGDFCRNNILFKYDENEKPISATVIDYQYARYGSPAFDLSLFFYLSTTNEFGQKYFTKMMRTYYESLPSAMKEMLSRDETNRKEKSRVLVPSFDAILEDYTKYGIVGLMVALFFSPISKTNAEEQERLRQSDNGDSSKYYDTYINIGGESMTRFLARLFERAVIFDGVLIGASEL